jgi:hypothetical protein
MILGLLSRGDDDVFRDEYCLANEVDSKWAAKPLPLNRTKGERSSNSKTLAVSPLDRILELGQATAQFESLVLSFELRAWTTTCGSILPTAWDSRFFATMILP